MEYLHMQQPIPTNATGVTVKLEVLDANNNYRPIGETTTDITGAFSYTWDPDISGKYKVIATFPGSESYGSSSASTAFVVTEYAATATPPTDLPLSAADLYFIPATIGLFIAIIVVGAVLVLLLLKKKP
jgi:hypothetical protein